jgi:hypothetical protein
MGTFAKLISSEGATMASQIEEMTGEPVLAAGQLRQGRIPSTLATITGTALIELARPRRSKQLPKRFALAVTESRVVAFSCIGVADDEDGTNYHVVVKGKERGSWPRQGTALEGLPGEPGNHDGTLVIGGERVPVCRPANAEDPETDALIELLGR